MSAPAQRGSSARPGVESRLKDVVDRVSGFTDMEALEDQSGANGILTFTFSEEQDFIVVCSRDGASRAILGSDGAPSATKGIYCAAGAFTYIPVAGTILKVYAPTGATVAVWGYTY